MLYVPPRKRVIRAFSSRKALWGGKPLKMKDLESEFATLSVHTASMSGIIANTPQPQAAYNVSKAGVIMLSKSLAAEWAKKGVRVNTISPGYISTEIGKGANLDWKAEWMRLTPMGRFGETREVASAVVYLASDASSYCTGSNLVLDGGYTCW